MVLSWQAEYCGAPQRSLPWVVGTLRKSAITTQGVLQTSSLMHLHVIITAVCCQWSGLTCLLDLQRSQSCPALHCDNTAMQLFTLSPQLLTAAAELCVLQNVLCSDDWWG